MVDDASPSIAGDNGRNRVDQLRSLLTVLHLIAVARFIDRSARRGAFASIKLLRSLSRVPRIGPRLDPLLARFDRYDRLHFELAELLRVCRALDVEELPYWLAGGWGLDALVGSETRHHGDLDFVLVHFHQNLPRLATLLTNLGYQRKKPLGGTIWFPDAEVFEDNQSHHIEVLNVNWSLVASRTGPTGPTPPLESPSAEDPDRVAPQLLEQFTTSGVLEGVSLPVLSVTAQSLFHLGYESRREDSHAQDLLRLITTDRFNGTDSLGPAVVRPAEHESRQPSTLLLVPIFSFPPDLWRLCRLYGNDLDLVPPHVTVAFPFLPLESITAEVVGQLSQLFEDTHAFDFELRDVRWFGTNVVYLEPSNADSFRSVTESLQRGFPQFHPYDDAFDTVIPHVTLSQHGSVANRRVLGRLAPMYLPLSARASQVWMMSDESGSFTWAPRPYKHPNDPLA
jgi:lincosamide nucleotidyltransferase A/C/D/E